MSKAWDGSFVMKDFEKIAADLGWLNTNINPKNRDIVGNPSKSPVGPFRNEKTKEYDINKEDMEKFINDAHKSISVADAMGEGALVENIIDQQKKDIDVAKKTPNGALIQVHAALLKQLVKEANKLESNNKIKEAEEIDEIIKTLAYNPFRKFTKIALWPGLIYLGLSLLGGATAANLGFFSSRRDSISEDIEDLYDILKKASEPQFYGSKKSSAAKEALLLLNPYLDKFKTIDLSTAKSIAKLSELIMQFKPVFEKIEKHVNNIEYELGPSHLYELGMDRVTRANAKIKDIKSNLQFLEERIGLLSKVGEKAISKKNDVYELQQILIENGLLEKDKATGFLNEETIKASKNLESFITNSLKNIDSKEPMSFDKEIISNGNVKIEIPKLREIIKSIKDILKK